MINKIKKIFINSKKQLMPICQMDISFHFRI